MSLKRQTAYVGAIFGSILGFSMWLGGFASLGALNMSHAVSSAFIDAGFTVEHVDVRGAELVDADEVARRLMIEPGENIFNFKPAAAKARVEELGWVREVSVLRLLPNRVVVIVNEREPLALWRADDTVRVLDAEGRVIEGADVAAYSDLPMVSGEDAPEVAGELVAALHGHSDILRRTAAFERVGGRRWDIITHTGLTVQLPEGRLEPAIEEIAALQAGEGLLDLPLDKVDLRNGGMVLRPRRLAARAMERGA